MGQFSYRKPPSAEEITEPVVEAPVSWDTCPGCGGVLEHEGVRLAYVTDLLPVPRPQVTAYRVQVCRCRSCGKAVRGRHPDIAPDQYGASAHRVGKRLMAAAHVLHYGMGVPVRKVPAVLRALTGVRVSQGAISQDALRRAKGAVGDAYRRLRTSPGCDRAEGIALLEEPGGGRCVLGVHQRNQDVGTQWRRPACRGPALRCVQRPSRSLPFSLNVSLPASR